MRAPPTPPSTPTPLTQHTPEPPQRPFGRPPRYENVTRCEMESRRMCEDISFYNREYHPLGCHSPASTVEDADGDSQPPFGVDLSGKATNLAGKSFTIAAILGLTGSEEDAMALGVQERLQNQRQLQSYLYSGHDVQRINEGLCRMVGVPQAVGQDNSRQELRPHVGQLKSSRPHSISCTNGTGRSKRIRTIFTPEQLERLEAEFERQQYMVGPERLYLAHALQLTEAQVKVWFQNRRIKWRKHHLEVTQQRLAVLQRHRPEERDDDV